MLQLTIMELIQIEIMIKHLNGIPNHLIMNLLYINIVYTLQGWTKIILIEYFLKSTNNGCAKGQYNLCYCHNNGVGININYKMAFCN